MVEFYLIALPCSSRHLMILTKKHLMNVKFVAGRFYQELLKFMQDHVNQSQTLVGEVEAKMGTQGEWFRYI